MRHLFGRLAIPEAQALITLTGTRTGTKVSPLTSAPIAIGGGRNKVVLFGKDVDNAIKAAALPYVSTRRAEGGPEGPLTRH